MSNLQNSVLHKSGVLQIYRDYLDVSDLYCKVHWVSESICALAELDESASFVGWNLIRLEDISRVRFDSGELGHYEREYRDEPALPEFIEDPYADLDQALERACELKQCVGLHTEEVDSGVVFIGEIQELDDEFLLLREYPTLPDTDRPSLLLPRSDITRIEIGSGYQELITRFHAK